MKKIVYDRMTKNENNFKCDFCGCVTRQIRTDKGVYVNGKYESEKLSHICLNCFYLETC